MIHDFTDGQIERSGCGGIEEISRIGQGTPLGGGVVSCSDLEFFLTCASELQGCGGVCARGGERAVHADVGTGGVRLMNLDRNHVVAL